MATTPKILITKQALSFLYIDIDNLTATKYFFEKTTYPVKMKKINNWPKPGLKNH